MKILVLNFTKMWTPQTPSTSGSIASLIGDSSGDILVVRCLRNRVTHPITSPYFRPFANATRGQLAKIVSNAAGFSDTPVGQIFADVLPENGFYAWIQRLASRGIMGGYSCGGVGEPCDNEQRPYFRPFNNVTRGQTSKIVSGAFFPDCQTPSR